jgi:hypothetical protein
MYFPKISVKLNIWGNYVCFVGTRRAETFSTEWDAMYWLMEQLDTKCFVLSDKSDFKQSDVDAFAAKLK